ncbi:hypothetical protein F0D31_02610 [Salmonella enterica subsp. enterica]|nr:hypothetical protein [Salmonella enterica subsp. enterica]
MAGGIICIVPLTANLDFRNLLIQVFPSNQNWKRNRIALVLRPELYLNKIGVEAEEEAPDYLDQIRDKFNGSFPKTIEFSAYARSTVRDLSSNDDPDVALFVWMEREEILFRTLEKYLLGEKLRSLTQAGVEDTEPFIKLVQSALQRRKSRAGSALENHLEQVVTDHSVTYTRTGVT